MSAEPWGVGKTDAEIEAEVERRVAVWAAERAAETPRAWSEPRAETDAEAHTRAERARR